MKLHLDLFSISIFRELTKASLESFQMLSTLQTFIHHKVCNVSLPNTMERWFLPAQSRFQMSFSKRIIY